MDHQATIDGPAGSARDLKDHVAGMARDMARIIELQAQLLATDLRQARAGALCAASCGAVALVLVIAALPVAVAGFGLWLGEATELSAAGGLLVAAAVAATLALALVGVGWVMIRRQAAIWARSGQELRENVRTLRGVFAGNATGRMN